MFSIDARTFAVNYFYRATEIEWCLSYNETVRHKVNLDANEELQAKLDDTFSCIINTGIFVSEVENDTVLSHTKPSQKIACCK